MKTIVTHGGTFHADDVFAVATLQLAYGLGEVTVVRTRDEAEIQAADIVVDVGGVYDVATGRFDHHQVGAPVRENGIPYSAFGMIWQVYGEQVAGSIEIAASLEKKLVLAVDADDVGMELADLHNRDIPTFELDEVIRSFVPARGSVENTDEAFFEAVAFARGLLTRLIAKKTASIAMDKVVADVYQSAADKRCLVFMSSVSTGSCIDYPEVEVVVMPYDPAVNTNWTAKAIQKTHDSFESRVTFPESWRGLRDAELAAVSAISDAVFCHKSGHFFIAGSKEGAIQAAEMVK
jgi:uncharacterized UPF0160 family protein